MLPMMSVELTPSPPCLINCPPSSAMILTCHDVCNDIILACHDNILGVAVSALVQTKDSSSIMDSLESIGATDILLFSIANSRM